MVKRPPFKYPIQVMIKHRKNMSISVMENSKIIEKSMSPDNDDSFEPIGSSFKKQRFSVNDATPSHKKRLLMRNKKYKRFGSKDNREFLLNKSSDISLFGTHIETKKVNLNDFSNL